MLRSTVLKQAESGRPSQPNDLDFRRIERALGARKRYRYVSPVVAKTANGYKVTCPCCSRNIDPEGGVIDIALALYDEGNRNWRLLRKNHECGVWELDSVYVRLTELLSHLNEDADRRFWQ